MARLLRKLTGGLSRRVRAAARGIAHGRPDPRALGYDADGLCVSGLNAAFLDDPTFQDAWDFAAEGNRECWGGTVPDIRWRAHTALWAAKHALHLDGDFVECGVFGGLLSMTICRALRFERIPRKFFLVDSFEGLREPHSAKMQTLYKNMHQTAVRNFSPYANAIVVKGWIPEVLQSIDVDRVAYLSIDLNDAEAELAAIAFFWPHLAPWFCLTITAGPATSRSRWRLTRSRRRTACRSPCWPPNKV